VENHRTTGDLVRIARDTWIRSRRAGESLPGIRPDPQLAWRSGGTFVESPTIRRPVVGHAAFAREKSTGLRNGTCRPDSGLLEHMGKMLGVLSQGCRVWEGFGIRIILFGNSGRPDLLNEPDQEPPGDRLRF